MVYEAEAAEVGGGRAELRPTIHTDYGVGKDRTVVRVNGRQLDNCEYKVSTDGVLTLVLCECARHVCYGRRLDNSPYCNRCFLEGHDLLNQFVGPIRVQ